MRAIPDELAHALDRLLGACYDLAREHAAYQSYRADAAKAMRERVLADYHRAQADAAVATSRELITVRQRLADARQVNRTDVALTPAGSGNTVRMLSR